MIHLSANSSAAPAHETCPVCRHPASAPARPSVILRDSGEELEAEILRGPAIVRAGIQISDPIRLDADIVAIRVPTIHSRGQVQLRIPRSYAESPRPIAQHHLGWEPSEGPANCLVLPPGWHLIESSVPTIVSALADGGTSVGFDAPADGTQEIVMTVQRS
jgi:hypothetical protein